MKTNTITGTYGSQETPCNVFTADTGRGTYYVVEGSKNVNKTWDEITEGVNVEEVSDFDIFTSGTEINSEQELIDAIEG